MSDMTSINPDIKGKKVPGARGALTGTAGSVLSYSSWKYVCWYDMIRLKSAFQISDIHGKEGE